MSACLYNDFNLSSCIVDKQQRVFVHKHVQCFASTDALLSVLAKSRTVSRIFSYFSCIKLIVKGIKVVDSCNRYLHQSEAAPCYVGIVSY